MHQLFARSVWHVCILITDDLLIIVNALQARDRQRVMTSCCGLI